MPRFLAPLLAPFGCALALLAGCDPAGEVSGPRSSTANGEQVSLLRAPPALDFRAIDREQLFPRIVVDGRELAPESAGSGVWRVRLDVPPNSSLDVEITWFERFDGEDLPLLGAAFPLAVGEDDVERMVRATEYDGRTFDFDGDRVSNVDERRRETNPLVSDADGAPPGVFDDDADGVANDSDNCASVSNPAQTDLDADDVGDACDGDIDGDGVFGDGDNCPLVGNVDQRDIDGDGVGDVCDANDDRPDGDRDGVPDVLDNCPTESNADQRDADGDGAGDVCEPEPEPEPAPVPVPDRDGDGVPDAEDNCESTPNADQQDVDGDGVGDACDAVDDRPDGDGDGVPDARDNCPADPNPDQRDGDGNGVGDACEPIVDPNVFSGEVTLALDKDGAVVDTAGRTFETGESDFSDFFALAADDPVNGERRAYVELAVSDSEVLGDGSLRVELRSLMFVEARDRRDEAGNPIRLEAVTSPASTLTLRPGDARTLSVDAGDPPSLLAPAITVEGVSWRGRISATLRYGGGR